jgi:hypothetical protein
MRRTKAKRTKAAKPRAPSDKALINHCVTYAQSIAAFREGFRADPDGSNEHAAALGARHSARAFQSLTWIASMPAATPEGLCAKARIVPIVIEDNETGCFEVADLDFLSGFANEVKKFLQTICDGEVTLQKPVSEGGAS